MKLSSSGNEWQVKTYMGSLCSLIILLIIAIYTYQKLDIYLNKKAFDIVTSE